MKHCKIEFISGNLKGLKIITKIFEPVIGKVYKPTKSHFIVLEIIY